MMRITYEWIECSYRILRVGRVFVTERIIAGY